MSKIIPTISSGTAGPLKVLHLPRLWMKVALDIAGKLPGDYPAIGAGFDQMTLDALEIDKEKFRRFMEENRPGYVELENWILEQRGGRLDPEKIEKHNAAVTGYQHDENTRKEILEGVGRPDDGTVLDAVSLNNLDDWAAFHKRELQA